MHVRELGLPLLTGKWCWLLTVGASILFQCPGLLTQGIGASAVLMLIPAFVIPFPLQGNQLCPHCSHPRMSHYCWWNRFVANPIKFNGYAGGEAPCCACAVLCCAMLCCAQHHCKG